MTTVERHAARWPCKDGDVRWYRMVLESSLESSSTSVDAQKGELQHYGAEAARVTYLLAEDNGRTRAGRTVGLRLM